MFAHLLAAYGRNGMSHACKQQLKVFVNLGLGAYGRARVAVAGALSYRNGGRKSLDKITFGFFHAAQELARIS